MSFLLGPAAGALVAGGVYYGFSAKMHTQTERHRSDLHILSRRLLEAPSSIVAPPSAAERVPHSPVSSMLKEHWNAQIHSLFRSAAQWDRRAREWTRQTLYGGDASKKT